MMGVTSTTLREQAYTRFMEKLFAQQIIPGSFVTQRELTELLEVPLGPTREALKRLEAEGMVKVFAQRGLQICQVDYTLIRETFGFRLVLEIAGLERFIAAATDDQIAALIDRTEETAAALRDQAGAPEVLEAARRTDRLLHDSLIAAMKNSVLTDAYDRNFQKIRLARLNGHHLPERSSEIMAEHMAILQAIRARDLPAAQAALKHHLEISHFRALGMDNTGQGRI